MIHYPEEIPLDAVAALMERLPNFPKDTDVGEIKEFLHQKMNDPRILSLGD